jgi:hypothetical protein
MVIFTTFQASCNSLKCKTPNRDGFFTSGPALPGTVCGSSLVTFLNFKMESFQQMLICYSGLSGVMEEAACRPAALT